MQVILDIPNEQLSEKILWLLEHFKNEGLKIIKREKSIDAPVVNEGDEMEHPKSIREKMERIFSENPVRAFREIEDPVAWQRKIRDEWERDDSA